MAQGKNNVKLECGKGCCECCMLVNRMWWLLDYVWDITFVFVVSKGMEYSLPYYHFQDQKTSQTLFPSFYIDVIETKWEQDDMLHMDHFSGFLCSHRIPDVPGDRIHIIDFCFSWTHPTPSNYHFPIPMPRWSFHPSRFHRLLIF